MLLNFSKDTYTEAEVDAMLQHINEAIAKKQAASSYRNVDPRGSRCASTPQHQPASSHVACPVELVRAR
jgi:hypothetical protein